MHNHRRHRLLRRFRAAYGCLRGWPVIAHMRFEHTTEHPIVITDPKSTVIENVFVG